MSDNARECPKCGEVTPIALRVEVTAQRNVCNKCGLPYRILFEEDSDGERWLIDWGH